MAESVLLPQDSNGNIIQVFVPTAVITTGGAELASYRAFRVGGDVSYKLNGSDKMNIAKASVTAGVAGIQFVDGLGVNTTVTVEVM